MLACCVQWDELLICRNLAKLRRFTMYFQNKSLMALQHGSRKEVGCNYWGMVCVCACVVMDLPVQLLGVVLTTVTAHPRTDR